jgi:hypothetical protein
MEVTGEQLAYAALGMNVPHVKPEEPGPGR